MKKTRGKKGKTSSHMVSHKKPNKPISFFQKFPPIILILLIVAILLTFAIVFNLLNSTGNVISTTGNIVVGKSMGLGTCGAGAYAGTPIDCGNNFCATSKSECPASSSEKPDGKVIISEGKWSETWKFLGDDGFFAKIFLYIFGVPITSDSINEVSAGIITIAIWLLLFISFSDIIVSFSSFSPAISWGIGFLIAVIAANLGFVVSVVTWCIGAFAFLAGLSVIVGLIFAFVAFIGINLGIGKFASWALQRRAVLTAHQAVAGGKKAAGAVEGIGSIGEALKKLGAKY